MNNDEHTADEQLFNEIKASTQRDNHFPPPKFTSGRFSIPNYSIQQEIHRGAQGVVYKALQQTTNRIVALKLVLNGSFATERQRFRFEREIQLASQLNHPNIVAVFDSGVFNNQPFCALEYVNGKPLNKINLPPLDSPRGYSDRLHLAITICRAVGYAHSRGIVHRDLKPANVLIDDQLEPHVLDFGLAKSIQPETRAGFSPRTMTGEFVGTLAYASPEQAQSNPELTDTRSDVYSLGVVFYQLFTDRFPYDVDGSIVETLNHITHAEPKRPTLANAKLDLDIETILLKSLAKDPERRYQNATQLGQDLEHYLSGDPIEARRDSNWYIIKKNVEKHKKAAATALTFLGVLVGALIAITLFYFQAIEDRNLAKNAQALEAKQRENAEFRSYVARIAAADASVRIYDTHDVVRNLNNTPPEHRAFEYWYLRNQNNLSLATMGFANSKQFGHQGRIGSVDYHPRGHWLVSGGTDGRVIIWELTSGRIIGQFKYDEGIRCVRVHPNGQQLAVGFTNGNATLLIVREYSETDTVELAPSEIEYFTNDQVLNALRFSADGRTLVAACGAHSKGGQILIFDSSTGSILRELDNPNYPVLSLALSGDGKRLATGDNAVSVWDFETGRKLKRFKDLDNWIVGLAWSPDGTQIASCAYEPEAKIWNATTGDHERSLYGHRSFVSSIAYSPDGKQIATGSRDTTLRFWDAQDGAPLSTLWGQYSGIEDLAFNPAGNTVATSGTWCIKTWSAESEPKRGISSDYYQRILDLEVSPDSKRVLASDNRGTVAEWDIESQEIVEHICAAAQPPSAVRSACYSPNGKKIAWANDDGQVILRDRILKTDRIFRGHTAQVNSVCFSPDGATVYSASDDNSVRTWNVVDGTSTVFCRAKSGIKKVLVSPDGHWIVTMQEGQISVHDANQGNRVAHWQKEHDFNAHKYALAIHPNSTQIAAPIGKNQVAVWEIPTGKQLASLVDHAQLVESLAYSPDGKRIATSSREGTIKLWDTSRFQVVLTLRGFNGYGEAIAFSPDSLRLVGGIYDGSIRQWKALPFAQRPIE